MEPAFGCSHLYTTGSLQVPKPRRIAVAFGESQLRLDAGRSLRVDLLVQWIGVLSLRIGNQGVIQTGPRFG